MNIKEAIEVVRRIDNMFLTEDQEVAKVVVVSFMEGLFMQSNKAEIRLQRQSELMKLSQNEYIIALKKKTRKRELLVKRQYIMYLLSNKGYSTTEIGRVFEKNHATATHSINIMKHLLLNDKYTQEASKEVDAELITYNVDLLI